MKIGWYLKAKNKEKEEIFADKKEGFYFIKSYKKLAQMKRVFRLIMS